MTDGQIEQMIAIADVIAVNSPKVAEVVATPKATAKPKATIKADKGTVDMVKAIVADQKAGMAEVRSSKVLKVDKYGNQWIAEYDATAYAAKKAEMIANGTYDSKNRSKVYKALGWVL